ncbi:hypothetical protein, partial [Prosthecochloris sp. ZM_2]|uniref:hypothetical protein n=1 Tax=Prosthecochloris sp. ZM_2 TaxID=2045206 RepID=UPI001F15FFA3
VAAFAEGVCWFVGFIAGERGSPLRGWWMHGVDCRSGGLLFLERIINNGSRITITQQINILK